MEGRWSVMGILLCILTTEPICVDTKAADIDQLSPNCLFPKYLQTDCSSTPHNVCRWSHGKRFTSREFATSNQWWSYRGHGEWNWKFRNGIAIAVGAETVSGTTIYSCEEKVGDDRFIVSYKDSRRENVTEYTCIQFIQRGLNVVEYKIGPFEKNPNDTRCDEENLTTQKALLLANIYLELPDCPRVLRGGYKIVKIYNRLKDLICCFEDSAFATFESDCLAKEGLYIDLGRGSNCSQDSLHNFNIYDVNFRCYSRPWTSNGLTFFITARRPRWPSDYKSFEFQCIVFEESSFKYSSNSSSEASKLYIFNDPVCPLKTARDLDKANFILYLKSHANSSDLNPEVFSKPGCTFPKEMIGKWIEKSTQLGNQEIKIENTDIIVPVYGKFLCLQRYTFNRENPNHCLDTARGGQWLGEGRVRFYFDDFIVSTNLSNGCRQRVARLGFTETLEDKAVVYRMSQSEPIKTSWSTPSEYFRFVLLKRFCSAFYIFEKDPFPVWGRNIEKIILKPPLTEIPKTKCPLLNEGNIMYNFKASYSDTRQFTCADEKSWIEFGCGTNNVQTTGSSKFSTSEIHVKYGDNCTQEDVAYDCLGKLKMFGEFSLIQNTRASTIYCAFYHREKKQILRMSSPQCSDTDWGVSFGHGSNFYERFELGFPSRCPIRTNSSNRNRTTRVPPERKSNSAKRNDNFKIYSFITFLIAIFCSKNL